MAWTVSAQTITWTDSFIQGKTPTEEQCHKWSNFLSQLSGKSFASVTMSGEFDQTGKSITDPAVATELARLLSSKTPGTVKTGDGHTWTVTNCDLSVCNDGYSISLSVDGDTQACNCSDTYAIRPQSKNEDWGGINTGGSCKALSQYMSLEFHSGVSIIAEGSTFICEGGSVVLTAKSEICSAPYAYLWSTGETTPSITVTRPGNYSVTVSDNNGCEGTSAATAVTMANTTVDAGPDVTFCTEPVQLNATGTAVGGGSPSMVNSVCMFDVPDADGTTSCDFDAADVCMEKNKLVENSIYTQIVSFSNPLELRYILYYTARGFPQFNFKLNDQLLGSYTEEDPTGACEIIGGVRVPRTIVFSADQFKQHWKEGDNALTIEAITPPGVLYLAGLKAEVVTSNESYNWSPTAGLSLASVENPMANPAESTVYTVTYTDANGCTATDQVEVKVKCNTAPVAVCKEVSVTVEDTDKAVVEASAFDGGSSSPDGAELSYSVSPAGPYPVGTTHVTFTVTDTNGEARSCETKVTVTDSGLPVIKVPEDVVVSNDPGTCLATLDLPVPETSDNCGVESISNDQNDNVFSAGENIVTWTATDIHGNKTSVTQKVIVVNAVPEIAIEVASTSSIVTHTPIALKISCSDDNMHTATINWGDNSDIETIDAYAPVFEVSHAYSNSGSYTVTITATDACGKSTFHYESIVVSHPAIGKVTGGGWFDSPRGAYFENPRAAGKATFAFQVSNENRNRTPEGHIVFNFREGDIKFRSTDFESLNIEDKTANIRAVGRLNGVGGYKILLSVAEVDGDKKDNGWGDHDKDWDDDDDDWDDDRKDRDRDRHDNDRDRDRHGKKLDDDRHDRNARGRGNNANDRDDKDRNKKDTGKHDKDKHDKDKHDKDKHDHGDKKGVDQIRVKIWNPVGVIIYDTQREAPDEAIATTPLSGGSIKIHQKKWSFDEKYESPVATSFGGESSSVYPNPFTDWVDVEFSSASHDNVAIQIMDMSGKVLYNEVFPVSEDGKYPLDIPENKKAEPGIYILVIKQGKKVEFLRLVRK